MRERGIYPQDCPRTVRSQRNRCGNTELACSPKYHGAKTAYWVESRTGAVAVVSRWLYVAGLSHRRRSPVWLGAVSCSRSSNRTGGSPASGSRKRLTFSPTEDRWPAWVSRPIQTHRREIPPEIAGLPATARCVSYTATDAASSWRVDRSLDRLGRLVPDRSSSPTRSSSG